MDQRGRTEQLSVLWRRQTAMCLATLGCLAVVAVGCHRAACPLDAYVDPAALLRDHADASGGWQALKAEARVEQWGAQGRIRGTVLMFLQRPDRVRFDVMTQFGPASILTSDGALFQLTDLRENRYLFGATCPKNIGALLGIEMSADNVLRLLTGTPPLPTAGDQALVCENGDYLVRRQLSAGGHQEISYAVVDGADGAPSDQSLALRETKVFDGSGEIIWRASFDEHKRVGDASGAIHLPHKIRFVDERNGSDTLVRIKSISLNPNIPDGVFSQEPRPGLAVEQASCD